jgi:predicted secreted protein
MTPARLSRFTARIFITVVLALSGVTASAQAKAQKPAAEPAKIVNVTEADNGKDVDMSSGQTLQVKLPSIAGTGYAWTVNGDPTPLKLTKQSTQRKKSAKPGAAQVSVLQFSASSPGIATLTMVYRRSWEYNVPPAKKFEVKVNVR